MASVVARPLHSPSTMPRPSFKGDLDSHVDELIKASTKKSLDGAALKERLLVPYFDSTTDASNGKPLQPLQGKASAKKGGVVQPPKTVAKRETYVVQQPILDTATKTQQQQRKGGKAKAGTQQQQQSGAAPPNGQPISNPRKHHRDPSQKNLAGLALATKSVPVVGRQSPPRKRQEHSSGTSPPDGSKYAGPAFTNSPMPDSLPIPTTSLLMQQTADKMHSGLVI